MIAANTVSQQQEFAIVDAFTSNPFSGNPAAIVVLPPHSPYPTDRALQSLATEFNLSETSFLIRQSDASESLAPVYRLRWFTPTREFDLCGHATLAAAHALFTSAHPNAEVIAFDTLSGRLLARREDDGLIALDFPKQEMESRADDEIFVKTLLKAVGVERRKVVHVASNHTFAFVEVDETVDVETLVIDQAATAQLGTLGLLVSSPAPPRFTKHPHNPQIVARAFFPNTGVAEDPVCGSAHCLLGPHYASRFGDEIRSRFVSRRGGDIIVRVRDAGRVDIVGRAVVSLRGFVACDWTA